MVGPLAELAALSRQRVPATTGNVFAPRPAANALHGRWGRRWLRPAGGAAVAAVLLARGSNR